VGTATRIATLATSAGLIAIGACAAHQSRPAVSARSGQGFVCKAFFRPSVYVRLQPADEIRVAGRGDRSEFDRSVTAGPFRFRVLYSDDRYEGRSLVTYVYRASTSKLIEETLFQFDREGEPLNQFTGEHGFTGLHYVYAPDSGAELQYMCSYGNR
jgi:hypothetical protein